MATLATGRKIVQIVACLSTISGFLVNIYLPLRLKNVAHILAIKKNKRNIYFAFTIVRSSCSFNSFWLQENKDLTLNKITFINSIFGPE